MQHLPEVQWGRVMCRVESPEKSLEWEVLGETWTSVAGRPALGHPLIAVATFLRGTSRFHRNSWGKTKISPSGIELTPPSGILLTQPYISSLLRGKQQRPSLRTEQSQGVSVCGFGLGPFPGLFCEPDWCFPLTWEPIETPRFQQTPLDCI